MGYTYRYPAGNFQQDCGGNLRLQQNTVSEPGKADRLSQSSQGTCIPTRPVQQLLPYFPPHIEVFFKSIKAYEQNIMPEYISASSTLLYCNNEYTPQLQQHIAVV